MHELPWMATVLAVAALIGHGGLHIAIYNRTNAIGLPRLLAKLISKSLLLNVVALPIGAMLALPSELSAAAAGALTRTDLNALPLPWRLYGVVCLASWPLLGIPWLISRPIFGIHWLKVKRQVAVVDVEQQLGRRLGMTLKCRAAARLPLNQIFELAVESIELPVAGLPESLDGYRIAQLSDLHFTGHMSPQWTAHTVDQLNRFSPDLIALTGDIIDKARCITWLDEALGHAAAADGCYFVLGNHDTRVADPELVRQRLTDLGWCDLGHRWRRLITRRSRASLSLLGNERPWFPLGELPSQRELAGSFPLLLAHSPDQFRWARRQGLPLMLAGHTHGGQGRLPLVGPLLGPSYHGSRYAAGDFYRAPTTMHVSRGLGGTHLLRINCRPELSLLTLRRRAIKPLPR